MGVHISTFILQKGGGGGGQQQKLLWTACPPCNPAYETVRQKTAQFNLNYDYKQYKNSK